MRVPLLHTLAIITLGATLLACAGDEEQLSAAQGTASTTTTPPAASSSLAPPTSTPILSAPTPSWTRPPDWVKYRWGNLTFYVPPAYEVGVSRRQDSRPEGDDTGLIVNLLRGEAGVIIDADDGTTINKSEQTDPYIEQVLLTLKVGEPVDRSVWPLSPDEPVEPKIELRGLRYWEPDPASGIRVGGLVAELTEGSGWVLYLDNGRSRLSIEWDTGRRLVEEVAPEDAEAFYRWADSVEVLAP